MAEDRGDSRVSSFLVGFLVGSLLAGGGASGYFLWQEQRLRAEAQREAEQRFYAAAIRRAVEAQLQVAEEHGRMAEALKRKEK